MEIRPQKTLICHVCDKEYNVKMFYSHLTLCKSTLKTSDLDIALRNFGFDEHTPSKVISEAISNLEETIHKSFTEARLDESMLYSE